MKPLAPWLALSALALCSACSLESPSDEIELQPQFEEASEEAQDLIQGVERAVRARQFEAALKNLNRVASRHKISPRQRAAMIEAYEQIMNEVDGDSSLETPGLYRSMAELSQRLHGEN